MWREGADVDVGLGAFRGSSDYGKDQLCGGDVLDGRGREMTGGSAQRAAGEAGLVQPVTYGVQSVLECEHGEEHDERQHVRPVALGAGRAEPRRGPRRRSAVAAGPNRARRPQRRRTMRCPRRWRQTARTRSARRHPKAESSASDGPRPAPRWQGQGSPARTRRGQSIGPEAWPTRYRPRSRWSRTSYCSQWGGIRLIGPYWPPPARSVHPGDMRVQIRPRAGIAFRNARRRRR